MFSVIKENMTWGGKPLSLETGKVARQADGSVIVRYGDSVVLATVVFSKEQSENASFFPLTINYIEKFYAAGRIPGGFNKREGKPSEREVLISRLIDRPIRPLFPDGFLNEVQVVCTTLSYDETAPTEIAAMIAASAALSISGVPFLGPIAGCKVGYNKKDGSFILNPSDSASNDSFLDLIVAGTKDGILMVESEAKELEESIMLDAVMFGYESFQPVLSMIESFKAKAQKPLFASTPFETKYKDLLGKIESSVVSDIKAALGIKEKLLRRDAIENARKKAIAEFAEGNEEVIIDTLFESVLSKTMRSALLQTKTRIDGRKPDEIRPITCEIDVLPKAHGSALFTRGETQALVVATLGSSTDSQIVDDISGDYKEYYMLHYNFPPYSVGEIGRMGAPGRREIGHGKLAWRATHPVVPCNNAFPYTIRLVSDITESNGSSSMATVCGSSLALMAAGVPIKSGVSGIAMGLIKEGDDYVILSDIMGDEDHLGDMDFKVAGTAKGITALQMDIKITSINKEILKTSLEQALKGRLHILEIMEKVINKGKTELSPSAPRTAKLKISKDKIKDLIGPGGKMIKEISEVTKSKIDISDDGTVIIFALNADNLKAAEKMVKDVALPPEIGSIFDAKVVKIMDFGAFVNIGTNKEGLVHISNISDKRINRVEDVLKVGQKVKVQVIDIDDKGRIKLSMKGLN